MSKITSKSIHLVIAVLSSFLFVGVTSTVNIYSVFNLNPMLLLSFRVSKFWKDYLVEIPGESERSTSILKTK